MKIRIFAIALAALALRAGAASAQIQSTQAVLNLSLNQHPGITLAILSGNDQSFSPGLADNAISTLPNPVRYNLSADMGAAGSYTIRLFAEPAAGGVLTSGEGATIPNSKVEVTLNPSSASSPWLPLASRVMLGQAVTFFTETGGISTGGVVHVRVNLTNSTVALGTYSGYLLLSAQVQ